MPIQTSCPQCQASYRLPDTQQGKRVRCKKCTAVFTAGEAGDVPVLQEATPAEVRAKRPSQLGPVVEELPVFEEVQAERPRPAPPPARRPDLDDDPPPRRYDDDVALPPARNALPLILGAAGGVIVLAGLGLVGAWFFLSGGPDPGAPGGQAQATGQGGTKGPIARNNNTNQGNGGTRGGGDADPAPRDVETAIAYLKLNDTRRRRQGLEFLKTAVVDPARRADLDSALEGLLNDRLHKDDVVEVVLRWDSRHKMTALEAQMKDAFKWKEAMPVLAKMGDERAAELIAEHLGKTFHEEEAARALKQMGQARAEKHAVKYLHHRRAREHVQPLIKQWRTSDAVLAEQAADDLAAREREVRDAAVETLNECKVVDKVQERVAKALAVHMSEDWFGSRKKTAKALAKWATADTLDTVHAYLVDRTPEVRELMMLTVARIKDEKSIPVLVLRIGSPDRVAAAKVLSLYGAKAEKSVQVLLGSTLPDIRLAGVQLLATVGTKDSVELLNKLAKSEKVADVKKAIPLAVKLIEAREKETEKKGG